MSRPETTEAPNPIALEGYWPLLALFGLEALVRALLSAVVAIVAYEVLGSAVLVSILYAFNSVFGLVASLLVPIALHRLSRRQAMTVGMLAGVACGLAFAMRVPAALVAAFMLQIAMNLIFESVTSVYLMERLQRRQIAAFESKRLLMAGVAYTVGPWLGVALNTRLALNLTFYVVSLISLALLFIYLTRGPGAKPEAAKDKGAVAIPNPLRFVPRFLSQPRLVLAWLLAFGRSGWWIMFFIYAPIYVARSGYPADVGGALVSLGLAPMLAMPMWARFARRYGMRAVLTTSFLAVGVLTIAAGAVSAYPVPSMVLLCLAAWCATAIDSAGNTPFMRAVHPYERGAMTSVFLTFRHASALVSPGIFAVVLWFLPFGAVFFVAGAIALGIACLALYLPRQM